MQVSIKIDVDTFKAMQRLDNMEGRASNFKPVFWYAQKELEKANAANFTSSGLPVGGWAPRTQVYAWPLMIRTGKLFSSLTNLRGAPNEIGRNSATFGTNVEYAKFHQNGTRNMPKRLIVFNPPLFEKRLANVAADYVSDGILPD